MTIPHEALSSGRALFKILATKLSDAHTRAVSHPLFE